MATVADHVISALRVSGVRRVYGLPGDSLNGFTDALRRSGDLTWEHVRHEETAAFAAAADAALTGELAVCAGSCGPGNLHLINGLFDAHRSRVPVLAIAAHIPRTEIGSEYFQETHPQELFRECSVYCELVSTPEMAPRILEMAMRAAVEERGVAVVVVPGEIFLAKRTDPRLGVATDSTAPVRWCGPTTSRCAAAAAILNDADNVTILAGAGVAGAHDALIRLAGTLKAPIVHALRGKEFIEYDNPYDVGMTGLLGFASGYKAIKEADVLLMLGTDFPYQQFYPDQREGDPGRHPRPQPRQAHDRSISGWWVRPSDTLAALQPLLAARRDSGHLDRCAAALRARPANRLTRWPSTTATARPSGRNTLRRRRVSLADRRCGVHRRRRLTGGVGGALPDDERPAQADRFVQPRHHGLRAATGDRRADRRPRSAGGGVRR